MCRCQNDLLNGWMFLYNCFAYFYVNFNYRIGAAVKQKTLGNYSINKSKFTRVFEQLALVATSSIVYLGSGSDIQSFTRLKYSYRSLFLKNAFVSWLLLQNCYLSEWITYIASNVTYFSITSTKYFTVSGVELRHHVHVFDSILFLNSSVTFVTIWL